MRQFKYSRIPALMFAVILTLLSASCAKTGDKDGKSSAKAGSNTSSLSSQEVVSGDTQSAQSNNSQGSGGNESKSSGATSSRRRTNSRTAGNNKKKDEFVVEGLGTDKNANYKVSGKVVVAVDTARPTDYEALFDTFKKAYPNVELEFDYFMHQGSSDNASEYLSTRAAAGKLPDVVFDEAGELPLYLTQGWVHPLDSFVKNDPDFKNIPNNIIKDYTFGGKLYALPHQAQYEVMLLNLSALDELNLKTPSLSWTLDDYEALLKKGTTNKFSGIEEMWGIPTRIAGVFSNGVGSSGYNSTSRKFELTNSLGSALSYIWKLREFPGLEAWWMRQSSGNDNDYAKKFGNSNLSDTHMAYKMGRTLTSYEGTWKYSSLKSALKFDWALWPYPQAKDKPGRMPLHVDHSFMISTAKNKEAAFQLLRYTSYSTEGNIARLSMFDAKNKGIYALNNNLYYPTVNNAKITAKFNSLPGITEVDKYLLKNMGKSYRVDNFKFVPSFNAIYTQHISPAADKISDGVAKPADVLPEAERKANEAMNSAFNTFETKLRKVQSDFDKK